MSPTPLPPWHLHTGKDERPGLSTPTADTSDGVVDAHTAEKFQQALEQRLSEPALDECGTGEQTADADPDDDTPVAMDTPE